MKQDSLDLNILKTITTNKILGLEFAYFHDAFLFNSDLRLFAKLVIDYMRAFRAPPTKRTLTEKNSSQASMISDVWDKLDDLTYNDVEYTFDLEKLKKRYEDWQLDEIKNTLIKKAKPTEELTKEVALSIQNIQLTKQSRSYTQRTVREHIPRFKERYIARAQEPETTELIKTHYTGIDNATDGLSPAEMVIIGGETNAGKSMLLSNMSIQMWMQGNTIDTDIKSFTQGYNVLYFSLEMPYEDCFARFLARVANVPQRAILSSNLTDEQRAQVVQAEKFIDAYPYEFDIVDIPRGLTIEEMELRYNDALLKYKPDIVVVDYLGLMESKYHTKDQDWLRLGFLAGQLHEFARLFNVIMLTAVQLTDIKRGSKVDLKKKSEEQVVGVHRIGRSSLIMHHANLGIQIEKRAGEERYSDLKYHIIKNRKGPLLCGFMIKDFANAALYDKGYISVEQNLDTNMEDIQDKMRKLRDGSDEQ